MTQPSFINPKDDFSKDYRTIYANSLGFQFSGGELFIRFGLMKDIAHPLEGIEHQINVAMSAPTAKTLMLSLKHMIEAYEKGTNYVIPVDPRLQESLKAASLNAQK
ncbi:hypothetical protein [Labrys neptuniae]